MATSASDVLDRLAGRPAIELLGVQTRLGEVLHHRFDDASRAGFRGVVFSDGACPGLGDAFSSFDGSSDYVRGYLTPLSSAAIADLVAPGFATSDAGERYSIELRAGVHEFVRRHQLPGELFVGVDGDLRPEGPNPVRIVIASGWNASADVVEIPPSTCRAGDDDERFRSRQRLATIATLFSLARWFDRRGDHGVEQELLQRVFADRDQEDAADRALLDQVRELAELNQRAWDTVAPSLPRSGLSVGESFTFGRVARLCASRPAAVEAVNFLYGWYHPSFKRAIGVPDGCLTDRQIAEPRTVQLAALGLLEHAPGRTEISLATSGWANNDWLDDHPPYQDPNFADFFSVAVAARDPANPQVVSGETLRCQVSATAGSGRSHGRRQLTRELGVSAAMLLLFRHVGREGDVSEQLTRRLLSTHGTGEFARASAAPAWAEHEPAD